MPVSNPQSLASAASVENFAIPSEPENSGMFAESSAGRRLANLADFDGQTCKKRQTCAPGTTSFCNRSSLFFDELISGRLKGTDPGRTNVLNVSSVPTPRAAGESLLRACDEIAVESIPEAGDSFWPGTRSLGDFRLCGGQQEYVD